MTEHSGCGEIRLSLGVYVVGAIDPAERSIVDAHLSQCADCRRELSELAGLPALLGRVPADDVEQLALGVTRLPAAAEPPPELLDSLLERVSARRRAHRWRTAVVSAAAALVIVGGGLAGGAVLHGNSGEPTVPTAATGRAYETEQSTSASTHVTAVVAYYPWSWGTAMKVWVKGVKPGTMCELSVLGKDGRRMAAGSWTERAGAEGVWYSGSSSLSGPDIKSFQVSAGGKVLVTVPAT
jgi:hypothetical protein